MNTKNRLYRQYLLTLVGSGRYDKSVVGAGNYYVKVTVGMKLFSVVGAMFAKAEVGR